MYIFSVKYTKNKPKNENEEYNLHVKVIADSFEEVERIMNDNFGDIEIINIDRNYKRMFRDNERIYEYIR